MSSQQMRRKGPYGGGSGVGEGVGLGCPGLDRRPHFLSKGMHKLPAAVLAKLHFNPCSPPEATISSLISSATARVFSASTLRWGCRVLPAQLAGRGKSVCPSPLRTWEALRELLKSVTKWSWWLLSSTPSF